MAYGHGITHTAETTAYWATQSKFSDTLEIVQPENTLGCNRMQWIFTRSVPTGAREDVAVFGMCFGKAVGGGLYSTLLNADMVAIDNAVTPLRTALTSLFSSSFTLAEVRWFQHRADHATSAKGNEVVGPPVRINAMATSWGGTLARNTDQVACTVSWRTAARRHWGRIYLPGLETGQIDTTYGRLKNTAVDTIATAFRTFEAAANTQSCQLGVWSFKKKAFLQLSEIRVDNVLDIQRRRRPKQSNYYKSFTS